MTEPTVLPYGGFLVKTLEDEKEREAKLESQAVVVLVNGENETLRPEALRIRGVDSLSTEDIKAFIDYYVNYITVEGGSEEDGTKTSEYLPLPIDEQVTFKVQWINDTAVNVVFGTHEEAFSALTKLSIASSNPAIENTAEKLQPQLDNPLYLSEIVQERETKPYNPIIVFKSKRDLSKRLGIESEEKEEPLVSQTDGMDEDESSVVLYIRQSFQSDRKVKNAKLYSRYYLLHGEPERKFHNKRRGQNRRDSNRSRHSRPNNGDEDEEDLFADKLKTIGSGRSRNNARSNARGNADEEEDLFADRLRNRDRSRSPDRMEDDSHSYRER
ncbi:uncharacterized protein RJT20DRAFT_125842 [Scheffersomyces xylosifermentans]|uniref:uncharacterized protein n=1 Tax=Scheffersomyces xylosifermentans TaxID=1304137 RepID=UPI00315DB8EC